MPSIHNWFRANILHCAITDHTNVLCTLSASLTSSGSWLHHKLDIRDYSTILMNARDKNTAQNGGNMFCVVISAHVNLHSTLKLKKQHRYSQQQHHSQQKAKANDDQHYTYASTHYSHCENFTKSAYSSVGSVKLITLLSPL